MRYHCGYSEVQSHAVTRSAMHGDNPPVKGARGNPRGGGAEVWGTALGLPTRQALLGGKGAPLLVAPRCTLAILGGLAVVRRVPATAWGRARSMTTK